MKKTVQVLKFGGTSLAGRRQWRFIAELATERLAEGHSLLLVCSALAGVTNRLEAIWRDAGAGRPYGPALERLVEEHQRLATGLGIDAGELLQTTRRRMEALLATVSESSPPAEARLLAFGEYLSTRLGALWLETRGLPVVWRNAGDLLRCETGDGWRDYLQARARVDTGACRGLFSSRVSVCITQGFVARNEKGEACLLGRGGSDISAILLATGLGLPEVEIYSDVPGVFSADPRLCERARLLLELDYAEALEITATGSGVIHPQAVRCAEDRQISIRMRQWGRAGPGTRIRPLGGQSLGEPLVKAISARQDMLAMLLENRDQNRQVGFLARVFQVFARQQLAIEQVATSETTTTLSLHRGENRLDDAALEKLRAALRPYCRVTLLPAATALTVIGRGIRGHLPEISRALGDLRDQRLLMSSVSANDIACTLLVPEADSTSHLDRLHRLLVESRVASQPRVYGPAWASLEGGQVEVGDPRARRVFEFSSCTFDPDSGEARLGYRFDEGEEFFERIRFPSHDIGRLDGDEIRAFSQALKILHLIAGVSYYKAGVPPLLKVSTLAADARLEAFLAELYRKGLAEFAWRNQLELDLKFEFQGSERLRAVALKEIPARDLLAMGGGKDSLVAAETLKSLRRPFTTVAVGSSELIEASARSTGAGFLRIERRLAPELAAMNAAGAWNGHVPVTAVNKAILVCQALLAGFSHVVFANESSASAPNLVDPEAGPVNHQYSKSLEYERLFQQLLAARVANRPRCYSLLRPWRELAIVRRFSRFPRYFQVFSSCNRNFHLQGSRIRGRWCGDCPKCRFAALTLALWLPREKVGSIIGRDLFADAGQVEGFARLCGFDGHKPFECVGEVEESRVAIGELHRRAEYSDSPVITELAPHVFAHAAELPDLAELLEPSPEHAIPADIPVEATGCADAD